MNSTPSPGTQPSSPQTPTPGPAPAPSPTPLPTNPPTPKPTVPPPTIVTLSFAGAIQYPASKNLRNACCQAVNTGAREIRILFSSTGGSTDEGFSLYNFLRALPVKLITHCVGTADSIGLIVFLAGQERFCCTDATFLFHDYSWTFQPGATVSLFRRQFGEFNQYLQNSIKRSEQLLKTRAAFTDEDLKALRLYEGQSIQDATFAKTKGIVSQIKDADVPPGTPIYNVDY